MKNILTTILISLFAATVAASHAYAQSAPDSAQSATVSATTVAEKKAPLYQLSSAAEPARRDTVSLTIAQIQGMRETATQLMGTYEKALQNIAKPESQQEFKSLFAPGAQLYNDLFGLDFSESLRIDDYIRILTTHAHDYKVALDNVDVSVVPNDSIYRVFVSCRKNTECRNDCGVQLISKDYYIYGYALTLEFVFPSPEAKPVITMITGDSGKNIPLLEQNFCIINEPKSFRRLWVNGQRPNYSAHGQYYASSSVSVHIDDPHVKVRTSADTRCHKLNYSFKPRRFIIKPYFGYGLLSLNSYSDDKTSYKRKAGIEFGFDAGVNVFSAGRWRMYALTGFAVCKSSLEFQMTPGNYEYETTQDIDGDKYIRRYQDVKVSQSQSLTDFALPVYFDFEYQLTYVATLYADLGVRFLFAGSRSIDASSLSYKVTGRYPQYQNLILDERSKLNGFTNNGSSSDLSEYALDDGSTSINLMGQLGCRFTLGQGIFFDIFGSYQRNLKKTVFNNGDQNYLPIMYDAKTGKETINTNGVFSSLSRQAFSINAGFTFKL